MLHEIFEKPVFFLIIALVIALAIRLTARKGLRRSTRLLLLTTILFAAYNAFLLLIYVISMGPSIGEEAHSYFRYMTHLSILALLALLAAARDWWEARGAPLGGRWRALSAIAVAAILLVPIGFIERLRFDLQMPQPLVWQAAERLAARLEDGDKLAFILPGDNRSLTLMLRAALALTPPRRNLDVFDAGEAGGLDAAFAKGYRKAFLSCDAAIHAAELLVHDGEGWRVAERWPYPPRGRGRWTTILAPQPFCES
jgi:hypothetical protein